MQTNRLGNRMFETTNKRVFKHENNTNESKQGKDDATKDHCDKVIEVMKNINNPEAMCREFAKEIESLVKAKK